MRTKKVLERLQQVGFNIKIIDNNYSFQGVINKIGKIIVMNDRFLKYIKNEAFKSKISNTNIADYNFLFLVSEIMAMPLIDFNKKLHNYYIGNILDLFGILDLKHKKPLSGSEKKV